MSSCVPLTTTTAAYSRTCVDTTKNKHKEVQTSFGAVIVRSVPSPRLVCRSTSIVSFRFYFLTFYHFPEVRGSRTEKNEDGCARFPGCGQHVGQLFLFLRWV